MNSLLTNTNEPEKIHFKEIDALKGWAIFLVILGHAIIYFPVNLHQNYYCQQLFDFIGSTHMQLFFAISGFCFVYRDNYQEFISKKVKRLLVPYIVFNLLDMLPRQFAAAFVNRPRSLSDSLERIIFNGGELWFLYTLFIIMAIYPLFKNFSQNNKYADFGLLILLLPLTICNIPVSIFNINIVCHYFFWFHLGNIAKNYLHFSPKPFTSNIILTMISMAIWFSLFKISSYQTMFGLTAVLTALSGIIFSLFLTGFNIFNKIFADSLTLNFSSNIFVANFIPCVFLWV